MLVSSCSRVFGNDPRDFEEAEASERDPAPLHADTRRRAVRDEDEDVVHRAYSSE
jgi:hypothetical protein